MKIKNIVIKLILLVTTISFAQNNPIIIPTNIQLPKDTIVSKQLIANLSSFLSQKDKPNKENNFVLKDDFLETSVLLDEIKEIEKSAKYKDNNFYKGYLTNVTPLNQTEYLIQFSYIGINENTPILAASFEIIGKQKGKQYFFSSPLKRNTVSWKNKRIGYCNFHYKTTLNIKKATSYAKYVAAFDKKLKAKNQSIEWYGCADMPDLLQSIGVHYKLVYNGKITSAFSAIDNGHVLLVSGTANDSFSDFDPHDLWHERVRNMVLPTVLNKPVDEGCAYLYGGSWGLTWTQILKKFKTFADSNPNIDWLSLYNDSKNFEVKGKYPLNVDYVINALLVEKIEKEDGFASVMELLSCGKKENDNSNYFLALEKLTGINKDNFNYEIWKLIKKR